MKNCAEKNIFFFTREPYRAFARIAQKISRNDFVDAESFGARDKLARILAAECFGLAEKFAQKDEQKLSLQYMKLACKLLGLSLRPKKLEDLEQIKKALDRIKSKENATEE